MPTDLLKEELIADMKAVQALCWTCRITRNYYRAHGKYTEAKWQHYFPTFKDFLEAASIDPTMHEGFHRPYEFVNNSYLETTARYHDYFQAADLGLQTELNPILNLANSKAGDFFAMGGKLYQVTGRNGTAVYTRRYRWYNRLHDWLRG